MTPAQALALTLAVEVPLYLIGLVGLRLLRWVPALLVALAANLTHPVLWWVLDPPVSAGVALIAELLVWLVEAGIVLLMVRRRVLLVALVALAANVSSFAVGGLLA